MTNQQLKPCPFCENDAMTWKQGFVCKQLCACSNDECGAHFAKFTPEEWNTRATNKRITELLNANNDLVERVRNYARISHDLRHALLYARQHCVSWQGEPNEQSCKQHTHIINVIDASLNSTQVKK